MTSQYAGVPIMYWNTLKLYLVIFWFVVATALLFRKELMGDELRDSEHYNLLTIVAYGLALWNLMRWYTSRSMRRNQAVSEEKYGLRTPRTETESEPKEVTDPAFDFRRNHNETNGDGK